VVPLFWSGIDSRCVSLVSVRDNMSHEVEGGGLKQEGIALAKEE
jgi:hypothetical protein